MTTMTIDRSGLSEQSEDKIMVATLRRRGKVQNGCQGKVNTASQLAIRLSSLVKTALDSLH